MVVIGSILLAIVALKLTIIVNGIVWFERNGDAFSNVIEERQPQDVMGVLALMQNVGGRWLRFRDYRVLLQWLRQKGVAGRITARVMQAFYSSRGIVIVGFIYGLIVTWHGQLRGSGSATVSTQAWLAYSILLGLLACAAGLVVESIYANALFGGYGRRFRSNRRPGSDRSHLLLEIWSLIACAEKLAIAAIGAAFVAGSSMGAFRGFAASTHSFDNGLSRLLDAVYYVATTFATVGYGDIVPVTAAGKVLAVGIELSTFLLVVIGLFIVSVGVTRGSTHYDGRGVEAHF